MTIKDTISWLVKKVNEILDSGCGCEDCTGGSGAPAISFRWGKQRSDGKNGLTGEFTKAVQMTDVGNASTKQVRVDLLIVDIPNWEDIADKSPVLLIDRYKAQGKTKVGKYRKAGYKHEPEEKAVTNNNRHSELPLTGVRNILDFNMENYFKVENNSAHSLGMRKRYQVKPSAEGLLDREASYTHLNVRLRLTEGEKIVETNSLTVLRALMLPKDNSFVDYRITFAEA